MRITDSVLFWAMLPLAGCGGETSGGGSGCGTTTGCGGDITGTWHITAMCSRVSAGGLGTTSVPTECQRGLEAAVNTAVSQPNNAAYTFATDGTYQESGSITLSYTWVLDAGCLRGFGLPPASASTCNALTSSLSSSSSSTLTGTCALVGTACSCAIKQVVPAGSGGTYRVSGSTLYLDEGTPNAASGPYCVSGTSMSLDMTNSTSTGAMELTR